MHINCYMYYIVYVCVRMLPAGSAKLIMECCHNYRVAKHNISNFAADTGSARGNKFATVRFTWFDARDIVSQTCGLSQIPGSRAIPEILVSLYIHLPV